MLSESEFTSFIQRRLDAVKIQSTLESTENVEIMRALQTASKNFTFKKISTTRLKNSTKIISICFTKNQFAQLLKRYLADKQE